MKVNVQLLHVPSYVEYVISESAANYVRLKLQKERCPETNTASEVIPELLKDVIFREHPPRPP